MSEESASAFLTALGLMTAGGRVKGRTGKRASAALLAASLSLAGCGGDKPDPPSSTSAGASTTTTSPSPTTTSASPTTGATTDPNIPAAARAHTPAGAAAFVRYFFTQLNLAWATPRTGLVSSLSATTCKTCVAFEGTAAHLAAKRQHYQGDVFTVNSVGSIGGSEVVVVGEQPPGAAVDINGSVVKNKTDAQRVKFDVTLAWSSEGWRVQEIRVMK